MSDQLDTTYKTSDLYYAAYLQVAGVKFIEAARDEGGRVFFAFEPGEAMRELKREYFNHTAKVSALDYANAIRTMKAQVHL